jgi:hypothetical protein
MGWMNQRITREGSLTRLTGVSILQDPPHGAGHQVFLLAFFLRLLAEITFSSLLLRQLNISCVIFFDPSTLSALIFFSSSAMDPLILLTTPFKPIEVGPPCDALERK